MPIVGMSSSYNVDGWNGNKNLASPGRCGHYPVLAAVESTRDYLSLSPPKASSEGIMHQSFGATYGPLPIRFAIPLLLVAAGVAAVVVYDMYRTYAPPRGGDEDG